MKRYIAPMCVLVLGFIVGAGALVAHAKEPRAPIADTPAAGSLGSVDMEDIYNAVGGPQELDQAGRQDEADGIKKINRIMTVPYLEAPELEEYGTLVGKKALTPQEEARASALKNTSDMRATELRALETKADALQPAEKTRLSHLTDLRVTLQNQVRPGLVADFRVQHDGWLAEFKHRQIAALRLEVAKVAKEKHIDHVFDAGTLVFSVNDITAAVLQHLGKRGAKH